MYIHVAKTLTVHYTLHSNTYKVHLCKLKGTHYTINNEHKKGKDR